MLQTTEKDIFMKTLLYLLLFVVTSSVSSAAVISLHTYDVGQSGGRLGQSVSGKLHGGDVVGLQMVLHYHQYSDFPSYTGYNINNLALKLAVDAHGVMHVPLIEIDNDFVYDMRFHARFAEGNSRISELPGVNPVTNNGLNIDYIENTVPQDSGNPNGASGSISVVWNIMFTADGTGNTFVDLLAGIGGTYYNYTDVWGRGYGDEYPMTNNDLAGTTIFQVPEPATLSLLAFGGVAARRRRSKL